MGVLGSIKEGIVTKVKYNFERNCIDLIKSAYTTLKSKKIVDINWGEENITANICQYIRNSQQAIDSNIFVESEHVFYTEDILNNRKSAKSGSRIDLAFLHNWNGNKFVFYVEAKNLVANDFIKKNNTSKTRANKVQQRYIDTGIDHFISGYYPQGCLLGYVLNGSTPDVVDGINSLLNDAGRNRECLQYLSGKGCWFCYWSEHSSPAIELKHFFLNFTI